MSTESLSTVRPVRPRRIHPFWLDSRPFWAGIAIATMWLAVLFVGIFGSDFVTSSAGGNSTSIPVVVFMLPFVLPASISASRHGFAEGRRDVEEGEAD